MLGLGSQRSAIATSRGHVNVGLQTGIPICHNRAFGELAGACPVSALRHVDLRKNKVEGGNPLEFRELRR
jgi:hypothetical protein